MYKKTVLRNGLRIITTPVKGTRTATVFVIVGTGSRHETNEINGISHFLEHLFFKGTKNRRTTLIISEELEGIGAEFNAFTSKEYTGFYIKVPSFKLDVAIDIISDMLLNSLFLSKEIEREKGTIQEEIKMVQDDLQRYISDLFEALLYGNSPMGMEIIGTPKTVNDIRRNQIIKYFKDYYIANNMIISIAGNIENNQVLRKTKKYFYNIQQGKETEKIKVSEEQDRAKVLIYPKDTKQVHFSLGFRGYGINHPDKYILTLLSIVVGGGISSRLFISVRERLGLAYYIYSDAEFYTDTGYFTTQAGVDAKNIKKTISVILAEYKKVTTRGVTEKELKKVKDQIKSRTIMGLESSSAMASYFANQDLLTEKLITPEEKFALLDKVTVEDVKRVANDIFKSEKLNLALIGPLRKSDKQEFENILKL